MVIFIIFLIIIFLIFFRNHTSSYKPPKQAELSYSNNKNYSTESFLYKTKGIKNFNMKGMYFRNLSENEIGQFSGYAKCESNSHDQYAVGIYNENGVLLGYIPKGNRRLNESIYEWHNGKVLAWGWLDFDDYNKSWSGSVNIPIGLNEDLIEKIEYVLDLSQQQIYTLNKSEITSEEYFSLIDNNIEIKESVKLIGNSLGMYFDLPKNTIPAFSKQLEVEKDWKNLIKLEDYKELINELNEKFANATLKRIEIAKEKLSQ